MKELLKDFKQSVRGMNALSKKYLRIGNPLIFTSALLSLFLRLLAPKIGVFDSMIYYSNQFFELFKNLLCSFYIPALLIEIVVLIDRYDKRKR